MKRVEDRHRERRSLCGIRPRAELIEEAEALFIRLPQDADRIAHMGGKGGQALLNALLIPDIGEDLPEKRELRALCRRDEKPRLPHELEKPRRL